MTTAFEPDALVDALIETEPSAAARREDIRRRPRSRPRQPHRRAHRLQRGLRAARRDRPRDPDRLPADRRPPGRARSGSTAAGATASISTRPAPKAGTWLDYVAGTAWALGEAGLPLTGLRGVHRLHPPAQRRPLVVGRDRAGLGLGAARRRGPDRRPVHPRPLCQRAENALRRRPERPDGPVRRVVRGRGRGAAARLPFARVAGRSRCRPTSPSSSATRGRRATSTARRTTTGGSQCEAAVAALAARTRRSAACAT